MLFFHHGTSCPRCRAELARFARYYPAYRERDAEILAIGPDEPTTSAALATRAGLPFPLLSDPDGAATARQAITQPSVVVASRVEEIWAAWTPSDDFLDPDPAA